MDTCAHCLMTVADERHAAEIIMPTGLAHIFDSVECMAGWLQSDPEGERIHSAWVTDFAHAPALVRADLAFFLESEGFSSPMGLGIRAFAREADRNEALVEHGGRALDWTGVQALVAAAWPGGRPGHGTMTHGGHGSALVAPAGAGR